MRPIRLWTTALHRGLPAFDRPEILEAELSGLVLDCAAWGTPPAELPFLDPPPAGALAAAAALLAELGALAADGRITEAGRRMAALGAHPRLAAMMLAARTPGEAALAADLSPRCWRSAIRCEAADAPADIGLRLAAIAARRSGRGSRRAGAHPAGGGAISPAAADVAGCRADGDAGAAAGAGLPRPDRAAARRAGQFPAGRRRWRAAAHAADPLASAPLLAVAALELKAAARIRLAARLDPERCRPSGSPSRWRPASTGSPARCWRAGGGGWARWCWRPDRAGGAQLTSPVHWRGRWRQKDCGRCLGTTRRGSSRRGSALMRQTGAGR